MYASLVHNLGDIALPLFTILPQAAPTGILFGNTIDRFQHNLPRTALLHVGVGAITGAPTGMLVSTLLQHSLDNLNWSPFQYDGANLAVTPTLTSALSETYTSIDLTLAQRFIRAVITISFANGSTPTALVAADIILGGENFNPPV